MAGDDIALIRDAYMGGIRGSGKSLLIQMSNRHSMSSHYKS